MARDLSALLQAGKLSQRCPACGIVEAAGFRCSRCTRRTGPADWFTRDTGTAARAARGRIGQTETADPPVSGTGRRDAA